MMLTKGNSAMLRIMDKLILKGGSFMESENLPLMNILRSAEHIATTS